MTTFELIFFIFAVCPVITNSIHNLINSYQNKHQNEKLYEKFNNEFDPSPISIIDVLNEREYRLIAQLNFNSYLVIIIIIALLISLISFLYVKIGIIEWVEKTEVVDFEMNEFEITAENVTENTENDQMSQISHIRPNISRSIIRQFYLKHAIKCAISTITCLIIYQIFFYNYGLLFKYVGSSEELIVLFIENIRNK